jgi:aminoglycoside phosphotransferase
VVTVPEPASEFAAQCAQICAGFRADGPPRRARKSELLSGNVGETPVIAKRLVKPSPLWEWYQGREIAMYRAFAANPPGVRVPRLVAAGPGLLVIERLDGEPLATKRRPHSALPIRTIAALIAIHDQLATWATKPPALAPTPRVRALLRERLLEDPTEPVDWVRQGVVRAGERGLIDEGLARQIDEALAAHAPVAFGHGDFMLRNVIADDDEDVGIVDWECAGLYLRDWDLAVLWTQLAPVARTIVEDAVRDSGARWRAFLGLVVFALARELRMLEAGGVPEGDPERARLVAEIAEAAARIPRS